jgi:hypothetical protein
MPNIGVAPFNTIAIVNSSTLMSDAAGVTLVTALNSILPTFCNDWNVKPVTVTYVGKGKKVTTPLRCILLDNSDVQDALGYHDQENGVPYARVFIKTILDYGGELLYSNNPSAPTVSGTVTHEVLEMIADLRANVWWSFADGYTLCAAEVCDPVQSNPVIVKVKNQQVMLSDWILPAWSDPQATKGPYNHNKTLTAPLTVDQGGYLIVMSNGGVNNVMGSKISAYTKANMSTDRGLTKKKSAPEAKVYSSRTLGPL